jgi:hypothetical protein
METSLATLPVELLEKIILCLSYEEVAQMRLVSQLFNYTCMAPPSSTRGLELLRSSMINVSRR